MKIYLDTFVFMDILSGKPELIEKAEQYLKLSENKGFISTILLTELAFHVGKRKGPEKAEEILYLLELYPNLKIIPVSEEIAALAGKLRSKYNSLFHHGKIKKELTYFDCIHLATAITMNCEKFITGDKGFVGVDEIEAEIY